jgi:hypothetical protein
VFLRARYYIESLGIFNSVDEWPGDNLQPQSYNKWIYSINNPIMHIDPSGKCWTNGPAAESRSDDIWPGSCETDPILTHNYSEAVKFVMDLYPDEIKSLYDANYFTWIVPPSPVIDSIKDTTTRIYKGQTYPDYQLVAFTKNAFSSWTSLVGTVYHEGHHIWQLEHGYLVNAEKRGFVIDILGLEINEWNAHGRTARFLSLHSGSKDEINQIISEAKTHHDTAYNYWKNNFMEETSCKFKWIPKDENDLLEDVPDDSLRWNNGD